MQLVIDIDDEDYKRIQDIPDVFDSLTSRAYSAIRNGIPHPKTGYWIKCDILQEFKCSECRVCFRNKSNYCPNYGAKMESEG